MPIPGFSRTAIQIQGLSRAWNLLLPIPGLSRIFKDRGNPVYIFIPCLENTANQRPGLPLHILRYATSIYATGSIPLYFPVIPCAQQFTGVQLRTSQRRAPKPFNSYEPLRRFPITSGNRFRRFPNTSKDFRRFSENFKKS